MDPVDEELDVVHEGGNHGLPQLPLQLLLLPQGGEHLLEIS